MFGSFFLFFSMASSSSRSKKSKITTWLDNQKMPTGSSPVSSTLFPKYDSSSDEEYEEFLYKESLLLSGVPNSVKQPALSKFLEDFKCKMTSKYSEGQSYSVVLEFTSATAASKALKIFKDVKLNGHAVSLTRHPDPKFATYRVSNFKKGSTNEQRRKELNDRCKKAGEVLKIFFPPDQQEICYLYMALSPEFMKSHESQNLVIGNLRVNLCHMKGNITKNLFE